MPHSLNSFATALCVGTFALVEATTAASTDAPTITNAVSQTCRSALQCTTRHFCNTNNECHRCQDCDATNTTGVDAFKPKGGDCKMCRTTTAATTTTTATTATTTTLTTNKAVLIGTITATAAPTTAAVPTAGTGEGEGEAPATTAEVYGPPTPGSNRTDATVAPTDKPDKSDTFGPRPFVGLPDPTNDTVTVAAATFGPASTNVFTATTPPVPNATEAEETTEAPTAETTLDPRETTAANTEKKQNSDDARDDDDDDDDDDLGLGLGLGFGLAFLAVLFLALGMHATKENDTQSAQEKNHANQRGGGACDTTCTGATPLIANNVVIESELELNTRTLSYVNAHSQSSTGHVSYMV